MIELSGEWFTLIIVAVILLGFFTGYVLGRDDKGSGR